SERRPTVDHRERLGAKGNTPRDQSGIFLRLRASIRIGRHPAGIGGQRRLPVLIGRRFPEPRFGPGTSSRPSTRGRFDRHFYSLLVYVKMNSLELLSESV